MRRWRPGCVRRQALLRRIEDLHIEGRHLPVRQHAHQFAPAQVSRHLDLGQWRDTQPHLYRHQQDVRRTSDEPRRQHDGGGTRNSLQHDGGRGFRLHQARVPCEILGFAWRAVGRKVCRCRTQHAVHLAQPPRAQSGIRQIPDAHREVKTFLDDVHAAVGEFRVDAQRRILEQVAGDDGHQHQLAEAA
jgi:hypothetical protein